jgi:hypothetical protein
MQYKDFCIYDPDDSIAAFIIRLREKIKKAREVYWKKEAQAARRKKRRLAK